MDFTKITPVAVAILTAICMFLYARIGHYQERVEALERSCSSMEATIDTMEKSVASTQQNLLEWSKNLDTLKEENTKKRTVVRTTLSTVPWASVPVPADVVRMLQ